MRYNFGIDYFTKSCYEWINCDFEKYWEDKMELNVDQIRIVNSKPNGHVLVKGVAGSGKTTVAVSKLPMLVNHYLDKNEKILFVTYNKTLIQYTNYLMKDMDIQGNLFFEFDAAKQLFIRTIDSIITYYGGRLKINRKLASSIQIRDKLLQAIEIIKKKYGQLELISRKNYTFLNEEIDWLKSCSYIERETYLNVDRVGRMSKGENRYRLQKASVERNAIFDIYLCYEQLMEREGLIDYKTNALMVLKAFREGKLQPDSYRHIIVDESQDLTRVQLEIIKYLYQSEQENSSIMFIADISQSIYTQSWLSGQSFKSIGFDMSGKSNILSKNYRTTFEIAQAAYSLIEKDDAIKQNDIFVKPSAIDRHGDAPYYKHYDNVTNEAEAIADRIKVMSERYALRDIVVVAATRGCLDGIKDILLKKGILAEIYRKTDDDFDEDVIRMFTLHSVKGLEFPVLFIACINEGILPYSEENVSIGRRLLYVGMTRAKQELYLSSSEKQSRFIDEMDKNLLCTEDVEFSPLYRVNISEYLFVDKLRNIHSREEAVRQWFIRELITKKQYLSSNIDIEYPVQHFSERGFVDIVVFADDDEGRKPFIMVEVKQPGEDMDRALKQLRSYASCSPSVKYTVVTDGVTVFIEKVSNNGYVPVKSLPVYEKKESNLYEKYEYLNWINKKHYSYEINIEDKNEIIIKDIDNREVVACDGYTAINVIGEVAAGALKYANRENVGTYSLPSLFTSNKEKPFMLKVAGDSMINFQINDGDYVIIKSQDFAVNGDIVVAGRLGENEVTLKQYCNFDGTIGLMPGNPKYQPIMVPENQLFVNGILVGVLSRKNL